MLTLPASFRKALACSRMSRVSVPKAEGTLDPGRGPKPAAHFAHFDHVNVLEDGE
ncbi:hypothetical protein PA7_24830 [Pseudonocardia asaccharolytica DSM 44247 = NBRC 16224]|uniref:Uncharacterized protein n=1 Tax=Pseudonocardia asaccharolytica DSM 44247 = NBRC 16224 TaxID=1123024 RepID=A0A511D1I1_9PSEU|nr:hypothetical protein PA7_24830 [Pseudonocardia asaccharolytica DSM 44247 = NBRC 16224]